MTAGIQVRVPVDALLAGVARPYTRPGSMSAIDKRPLDGTVAIGELGLAGDEQGDRRVHGGPDKAIHHYPFEHYATWRAELGPLPLLESPGAFGENISTRGPTEAEVCLGDRFDLGTAVPAQLGAVLGLPLVPSWRRLIELRLASSQVEEWSRRVDGPPGS